ncbi:hypothetical protein [Chlorogloeopsis sp. ULAP02]|uniref:hypothetical protein n=1 Tax=Chlorogloeopsis sp. ULAP02 TaxID=3107926 RepID=UPI003136A5F4
MTEVFLDTSFAIALSSITDQNHLRAEVALKELGISVNRNLIKVYISYLDENEE